MYPVQRKSCCICLKEYFEGIITLYDQSNSRKVEYHSCDWIAPTFKKCRASIFGRLCAVLFIYLFIFLTCVFFNNTNVKWYLGFPVRSFKSWNQSQISLLITKLIAIKQQAGDWRPNCRHFADILLTQLKNAQSMDGEYRCSERDQTKGFRQPPLLHPLLKKEHICWVSIRLKISSVSFFLFL